MYIVIELQTTNNQTGNIVQIRSTKEEAMSLYHLILSSAAISNIEYHTAVVMDEEGRYLARECYKHLSDPEIVPVEPMNEGNE